MRTMKLLSTLCLLWTMGIVANAEEIPNNEIWYTSSDEQIVYPSNNSAFGSKIVSNTYSDGKGIIRFSDNVLEFGNFAFAFCRRLTSISIPNSVSVIGDSVFYDCSSLISITLSDKTTSIGNYAFVNCISLTAIEIPNTVNSIGNSAFVSCNTLKSITIPNTISDIGDNTFYGCVGLLSVIIPNSVKKIGKYAFYSCSKLNTITIPESVEKIEDYTFYNCSNLESVDIVGNTRHIGFAAFAKCINLKSITFPNSLIDIGDYAFFSCQNILEVNFGSSLTSIGTKAFDGCICITSISLPNTVTSIGSCSFGGCTNISSINIPSSVTKISSYTFDGCKGLKLISLPNSINSIEEYAFNSCISLETVTIPSSVKTFGKAVFCNCSKLNSLKVTWERPLSIADNVFNGFDKTACTLLVPKGTSSMYMSAPVWIGFPNIQEYSSGEDECTISVKQGEGGCVKNVVELGKTYQYIISPADGWSINSVSFNGADVTSQLFESRFSTPIITGNSELNIVFKQGGSDVKDLANSSVKVLASNGSVTISGNNLNERVTVYSVGGSEVASNSGNCIIQLSSGVYIIKVGEEVFKVAI